MPDLYEGLVQMREQIHNPEFPNILLIYMDT